jgi:4-hydroxyphenylpyruvate dioxygenase
MIFTAPLSQTTSLSTSAIVPFPSYNKDIAKEFIIQHGFGVKAVGIEVEDVISSFNAMIENGGQPVVHPHDVQDNFGRGFMSYAEVQLYGDVCLRLIDKKSFTGSFLPNFQDIEVIPRPILFSSESRDITDGTYGFMRFDHVVGNLWALEPTVSRIKKMTVFLYKK